MGQHEGMASLNLHWCKGRRNALAHSFEHLVICGACDQALGVTAGAEQLHKHQQKVVSCS